MMKLEKYHFFCPRCEHQLDEDGNIHLKTKRQNGDEGLIHLSTSFSSYAFIHEPAIDFEEDELVDFHCTKCKNNLQSKEYPEYTLMTMRTENKFDFEILFSKKAGMHRTYIITEDGVEFYGEHNSGKLE